MRYLIEDLKVGKEVFLKYIGEHNRYKYGYRTGVIETLESDHFVVDGYPFSYETGIDTYKVGVEPFLECFLSEEDLISSYK